MWATPSSGRQFSWTQADVSLCMSLYPTLLQSQVPTKLHLCTHMEVPSPHILELERIVSQDNSQLSHPGSGCDETPLPSTGEVVQPPLLTCPLLLSMLAKTWRNVRTGSASPAVLLLDPTRPKAKSSLNLPCRSAQLPYLLATATPPTFKPISFMVAPTCVSSNTSPFGFYF